MRDSQKSKLYAAERVVPHGQRFATTHEVEAYLMKLIRSKWFRRRWPTIDGCVVYDGRGRSHACGWRSMNLACMKLPRWSRTEAIVLHELAHSLGRDRHGPKFAKAFLVLVEHKFGKEVGKALRASYKERRVRYKAKRPKRPLTPAQEAALAKGRAALAAKRCREESH